MATKDYWSDVSSEEEFAFGVTPNSFFANQIEQFSKGKILLPSEGRGRNAVFAARLGWEVCAFDFREKARESALELAKAEKVNFEYHLKDYENLVLPQNEFDLVALIYAHMPMSLRTKVHQAVLNSLKPGGRLIMEAFHKNQLGRSSGGPQNLEMLFSESELESDFEGLEIISLEEVETEIDEGPRRQGTARVIRLLARKPEDL